MGRGYSLIRSSSSWIPINPLLPLPFIFPMLSLAFSSILSIYSVLVGLNPGWTIFQPYLFHENINGSFCDFADMKGCLRRHSRIAQLLAGVSPTIILFEPGGGYDQKASFVGFRKENKLTSAICMIIVKILSTVYIKRPTFIELHDFPIGVDLIVNETLFEIPNERTDIRVRQWGQLRKRNNSELWISDCESFYLRNRLNFLFVHLVGTGLELYGSMFFLLNGKWKDLMMSWFWKKKW